VFGSDDNQVTEMSHFLKPQTALTWYRRLVVTAVIYSLLVVLFSVISLVALLNRPYGGFFWSWDNTHGVYRVDDLSLEGMDSLLRPRDFILAVEGQAGPRVEMRCLAQGLYESAVSVCLDTPPVEVPVVHYRVLRRGEETEVEAPVHCFRFTTLLRLAAIPVAIGLLIWALGLVVYRAGPQQELNLVFALIAALATANIVTQGANVPGIETKAGQLAALFVVNPSAILVIPVFYHLIAILPTQHPSRLLCRTRWLWYGLIPIALVALGTVRFQLGTSWHPLVGLLDQVVSWGAGFYLYSAFVILVVRYLRIYKMTPHRQARHQVKLIGLSVLATFALVPFLVARQEPRLMRWIPINQSAMLSWMVLVFIGVAFAILRYQVFPRRVQGLNVLVTLAVAVGVALISSPIPLLGAELGFVALLLVLIGLSAFWTLPNPLQRALRRLTSPGTIEREIIERFNADIQGLQDLDTLPLAIVQSLERHLELSFAALWLEHELGVLTLEIYTDQAPAADLPDALPSDVVWQEQPARLTSGVLATAGCEIMLPLAAGRNRVGIVGLGRRWTEEVFDETDLVALGVMAHQAALALHTARQIRTLRLVPLQVEQAQLEERDRISKDLHDSTLAQLMQLTFQLEEMREELYTDPARSEELLEACIRAVNKTALELRKIMRNLSLQRFAEQALLAAIQEYVSSAKTLYETVSIDVQADPEIENLLSSDKKLALLRICQQALDNALAHAQAQSIRITLQPSRDRDVVEFSIVDNGRGFIRRPTGEFIEHGHHGLYIMESRVLQYGGHLEIESTPGQGTVVKGYLPVEKDKTSQG
jgi:signal transduction histidine kinase